MSLGLNKYRLISSYILALASYNASRVISRSIFSFKRGIAIILAAPFDWCKGRGISEQICWKVSIIPWLPTGLPGRRGDGRFSNTGRKFFILP